jgi:hypothetical protein
MFSWISPLIKGAGNEVLNPVQTTCRDMAEKLICQAISIKVVGLSAWPTTYAAGVP